MPLKIQKSDSIKEMIFPKGLDLDRPKRPRTVFSDEQLIKLENVFRKTQYVVGKERHRLSKLLGLTDQQVKVWFQNRRTKLRKGKSRESIEVNLLKLSEAERLVCPLLREQQSWSVMIFVHKSVMSAPWSRLKVTLFLI
ncbi:Homeobox domain containing protein [Trichuris trichiura]|uniref:Homeobox domain containing protein n=1 Tax=Trichuris trichiura TaxID=36087 RepID=A0A077ZLP3_TRITR|nr:Homeobox domain containing protein [Trichuris trichiura]